MDRILVLSGFTVLVFVLVEYLIWKNSRCRTMFFESSTVKPSFIAPRFIAKLAYCYVIIKYRCYKAKLAYRHPPRCQKIKWSIYCRLSLATMPISYVTRWWFYRCLLFLQLRFRPMKVNWSSCSNHLITVNCCVSVSFIVCELFSLWIKFCLKFSVFSNS